MTAVADRCVCGLPVSRYTLRTVLTCDISRNCAHRRFNYRLYRFKVLRRVGELGICVFTDSVVPNLSRDGGGEVERVVIVLVSDSDTAYKVARHSDKGLIIPVIGRTGLTAENLIVELCRSTCTVFDNVLEESVHYPCGFIGNSLTRISVIFVDDILSAVLDLGDDVSLVVNTLVAVRNVSVYEVFERDTVGKSTE